MAYYKIVHATGNTASSILSNRRGNNNEIAIDPTTKEFIVYDGSTLGGIRMARKSDLEALTTQVKNLAEAVLDLTTRIDDYFTDYDEIVNPPESDSDADSDADADADSDAT